MKEGSEAGGEGQPAQLGASFIRLITVTTVRLGAVSSLADAPIAWSDSARKLCVLHPGRRLYSLLSSSPVACNDHDACLFLKFSLSQHVCPSTTEQVNSA